MEDSTKKWDCSRGCTVERTTSGELVCQMESGCCKLSTYNWLEGFPSSQYGNIYEIRFKNTHKGFYINDLNLPLAIGDIVAVEAANGHDIGIVNLMGPAVAAQLSRRHINPQTYEFRKIYRKARLLDIEKWQEAIAREHSVMIRSRQIAAAENLEMKIGDVEFQGDGSKATFYYIANERVDFRRLIKLFAAEFAIRIEMRQFGARQEAGLIGGLGVCGQELCCSRWMVDFNSITTQAARAQGLSLNPQKLAGQCSKLKCCINYEAAVYMDAQKSLPVVSQPLDTEDGPAYLVKTDVLKGELWFSYDAHSLLAMYPVPAHLVKEMIAANKRGEKVPSLKPKETRRDDDYKTAAGEENISRFDRAPRKKKKKKGPAAPPTPRAPKKQ